MKTKLIYVFSFIENSLAFEWMAQAMDASRYDIHYVFLNPVYPALAVEFAKAGYQVTYYNYNGKKDFPAVTWQLIKLFRKLKPDIVHAHLFDASLAALSAARLCGVPKRIYTRHHSTFHLDYHKHAVKYDKFINSNATHIVAITKNVAEVLINREGVNPAKVFIVNHGFNFSSFNDIDQQRIEKLKIKYNATNRHPVVGVISRFTEWKGIQFIIPAFKKLLNTHPDSLLILANANGDYITELDHELAQLPINSYCKIKYEQDVLALYKLFDVFVHVPINNHAEAFGQVYVEAMASGLPCIFTHSGIANDFIATDFNAVVVPYENADAITDALNKIISDAAFANKIAAQGKQDALQHFDIKRMIDSLEKVYES